MNNAPAGVTETIVHPFAPVWDAHSRVLILGTLPSPKSRAFGFYYGHPANRFWATLAQVLQVAPPPRDTTARAAFLLEHRIAVWDVLHSCTIRGASDNSIGNPVPNPLRPMIAASDIGAIFTTGRKATALYSTLCAAEAGLPATYLPSTSPANASWNKRNDYAVWQSELTRALGL